MINGSRLCRLFGHLSGLWIRAELPLSTLCGPSAIDAAASLFNMVRNTGSAIGISLVSNMLNSHEQIHQAYLTEHFTPFDAWRLDLMSPSRMPGSPQFCLMQGLVTQHTQGF